MNAIAIIPARGGSKGIPGKNKALVGGISLIEHAIRTAREVPVISRIVVSSDDQEILAIARQNNVEAINRPSSLAEDDSPIELAIEHALIESARDGQLPETLVLLQPTSPLRDAHLLSEALNKFETDGAIGSVFGVVPVEHHPAKTLRIDGEFVIPFTSVADLSAPRQSLPRVVRQSGSLYIVSTQNFLASRTLFAQPTRWVEVDAKEAIDIDNSADLLAANQAIQNQ
jgi:CMP-N-acetylneuraminic acid synthetase